jgi:flavin-dependent dehydrogenase
MSFQENYFDVIIIGAGPAGSSCAKILSDNGVSVLVVDKKKFPRIKSCCGFLTNRAVDFIEENFGIIPERIYCKNRKIQFLWSSTGINYNQVSGYDAFTNVYRDHFDNWLIKQCNAQFTDGLEFKEHSFENDQHIIICKNKSDTMKFRSKYLVCACGANSILRKKLDLEYKSTEVGASIQKVFKGQFSADKNNYYVIRNKKYTDNAFSYHYFKDDFAFIGTGWTKKYNSYFENWFEHLKNKYKFELELVRDERCCVEHQLGTNKKFLGKNSILFAGEAAGLIENWGIGITTALISGKNAAHAILQGNDACSKYSKLMEREIDYIENTYKW